MPKPNQDDRIIVDLNAIDISEKNNNEYFEKILAVKQEKFVSEPLDHFDHFVIDDYFNETDTSPVNIPGTTQENNITITSSDESSILHTGRSNESIEGEYPGSVNSVEKSSVLNSNKKYRKNQDNRYLIPRQGRAEHFFTLKKVGDKILANKNTHKLEKANICYAFYPRRATQPAVAVKLAAALREYHHFLAPDIFPRLHAVYSTVGNEVKGGLEKQINNNNSNNIKIRKKVIERIFNNDFKLLTFQDIIKDHADALYNPNIQEPIYETLLMFLITSGDILSNTFAKWHLAQDDQKDGEYAIEYFVNFIEKQREKLIEELFTIDNFHFYMELRVKNTDKESIWHILYNIIDKHNQRIALKINFGKEEYKSLIIDPVTAKEEYEKIKKSVLAEIIEIPDEDFSFEDGEQSMLDNSIICNEPKSFFSRWFP